MTTMEKNQEALERGSNREPGRNDMVAITAFCARGIPAGEIETFGPSQNVRTYPAWQALGRQVRRGEKAVRLTVWRPIGKAEDGEKRKCRPVTSCVFHISQTDEKGGA